MENVVIIGTGCAGWAAAIYAARANLKPLVFAGEEIGGQLATTSEVENYPGFPEGIDGATLMMQMMQQAERFGTRTEYKKVAKVEQKDGGGFIVTISEDEKVETKTVIVATGASARKLHLENEDEYYGKKGLTSCATCDGAFYPDVPVCVVGGGDSAAEEANFLTKFASKVYLIHRRDELRASKIMAERVLANPKVEPIWNSEVTEYRVGDDGMMRAVGIRNRETGEESELEIKCVFLAIGHIPNTGFLGDLVETHNEGYIVQAPHSTATNVPGLYAAGDVADSHYQQAITAAGDGCRAALDAEKFLSDQEES